MLKGYWLVRADVAGPEAFQRYAQANAGALKKYGGRFVARAGRTEVVEGASRARNTVVEFPSFQAALDCYRSAEYQAAIKLRLGAATLDVVIVEGYEGPQPA